MPGLKAQITLQKATFLFPGRGGQHYPTGSSKNESRTPASFQRELQITQVRGEYEGPSNKAGTQNTSSMGKASPSLADF